MYSDPEMAEYLKEIRDQVCSRCIEKPPGGPPCAPLGKSMACHGGTHTSEPVLPQVP